MLVLKLTEVHANMPGSSSISFGLVLMVWGIGIWEKIIDYSIPQILNPKILKLAEKLLCNKNLIS